MYPKKRGKKTTRGGGKGDVGLHHLPVLTDRECIGRKGGDGLLLAQA